MISRYFDQDKVMMLNAVYDTLESMDVRVLHVNSEAGSIIFRMDQSEPIRMLICTLYPGRGTRISMGKMEETEEMNAQETEQVEVFLDELESGLRKIQSFDVHTGK